jgi:oligosaccharyltransferase complex subunit delta (ribophorin II)
MRLLTSLLLLAPLAQAAASAWGFDGASVSVAGRKSNVNVDKQVFSQDSPLDMPLVLPAGESLRLQLTTTEGKKAKRPHQAFLILTEPESGLEAPFPLKVTASGSATVDITQKDLPSQLLLAQSPLRASLIIGSFGVSKPAIVPVFEVDVKRDPNVVVDYTPPLRYGKLAEIHHQFKPDPQNPPKVVSLVFAGAVLAALPALFITVGVPSSNGAIYGFKLTTAVACSWCQRQPPGHRAVDCSPLACRLLWQHCRPRGCIWHVLLQVELVPDAAGDWRFRRRRLSGRNEGAGRGAVSAAGGAEVMWQHQNSQGQGNRDRYRRYGLFILFIKDERAISGKQNQNKI